MVVLVTESRPGVALECHNLRHITTSGLTIDHASTGCTTYLVLSTYTQLLAYIIHTLYTTIHEKQKTIEDILE